MKKWMCLLVLASLACSLAQSAAPTVATLPLIPPATPAPAWESFLPYFHGISPQLRSLLLPDKRPLVFSKVGDSITVAPYFLNPVGEGNYYLADFGGLESTIMAYRQQQARNHNSFANTSLAAYNGWTSDMLLSSEISDKNLCLLHESALECEYRLTKPSIALIMVGTNDVSSLSVAQYRANMEKIIETSLAQGVIPAISTLPMRQHYETKVTQFNQVLFDLCESYQIPLWDYGAAMAGLPAQGLSRDGAHPSIPPDSAFANFSPDHLQYGFNLRNLMALLLLHLIQEALG